MQSSFRCSVQTVSYGHFVYDLYGTMHPGFSDFLLCTVRKHTTARSGVETTSSSLKDDKCALGDIARTALVRICVRCFGCCSYRFHRETNAPLVPANRHTLMFTTPGTWHLILTTLQP